MTKRRMSMTQRHRCDEIEIRVLSDVCTAEDCLRPPEVGQDKNGSSPKMWRQYVPDNNSILEF